MTKYRFDGEFENERLVDTVELTANLSFGRVMVYSPKLQATIILRKKELYEVKE
jgi:hypothetical protein